MQKSLEKVGDRRRARRYAVDEGLLEVSWLDLTGKMKVTRTRALDISETGISIQLPEAAMPMLVRFRSERFRVQGAGSVKYCRPSAGMFIVGLEFIEDLHWRPPPVEVSEPIAVCDPEAVY